MGTLIALYSVSDGLGGPVLSNHRSRCVTTHGTSSHLASPINPIKEKIRKTVAACQGAREENRTLSSAVTVKNQKNRSCFLSVFCCSICSCKAATAFSMGATSFGDLAIEVPKELSLSRVILCNYVLVRDDNALHSGNVVLGPRAI